MTDGVTISAAPELESVEGAVVFTDIVGFTEFTAIEGDAAANDMLSAQEAIVAEELPDGARVVKELGDGLMLWFPQADAALHTCLALLHRFERYQNETARPLWVRMGMHWGRQTRRRDDLIGHDVNLASRIADEADGSELLLSEVTLQHLGEAAQDVPCEEIGQVMMKGIPDAVRLYRAVPAFEFE